MVSGVGGPGGPIYHSGDYGNAGDFEKQFQEIYQDAMELFDPGNKSGSLLYQLGQQIAVAQGMPNGLSALQSKIDGILNNIINTANSMKIVHKVNVYGKEIVTGISFLTAPNIPNVGSFIAQTFGAMKTGLDSVVSQIQNGGFNESMGRFLTTLDSPWTDPSSVENPLQYDSSWSNGEKQLYAAMWGIIPNTSDPSTSTVSVLGSLPNLEELDKEGKLTEVTMPTSTEQESELEDFDQFQIDNPFDKL